MPDLPFVPSDPAQAGRVASAFDPEDKILRAIEALAPLSGQRVVVLGQAPVLAARLAARGAEVTSAEAAASAAVLPIHSTTGLPDHCADIVIAPWSGFDGAADAAELAEAERILVPGSGRLLLLQDYGRDDLTPARGAERTAHLVARSRRDGWLLGTGFRVHVLHAWWRFAELTEAAAVLRGVFGAAAEPVIAGLRRPAVTHNVAIYHRTAGES